jgi:hypothetical protein
MVKRSWVRQDQSMLDKTLLQKRKQRYLEELNQANFGEALKETWPDRDRESEVASFTEEAHDDASEYLLKELLFYTLLHLKFLGQRKLKKGPKRVFQKQNLASLLTEPGASPSSSSIIGRIPTYWSVQVKPSERPPRHFCSVCG